jgi:hypothetical protein
MPFQDEDIPALLLLLSAERLGALVQLTGSTRAAIELHQETLAVGAALMNVTATIEIALRNSISENLSRYFGVPGWLHSPPTPFEWKAGERKRIKLAQNSAQRAEYSKLGQAEKTALDVNAFPNGRPASISHFDRTIRRQRTIAVSEGKVIAELTLYFWKRLYGPEYDQTLWRTTLKKTFPNKKLKRADVAENLERIYQSRNRLAHHEPVLHKRFRDTMSSIKFVVENLGTSSPTSETPLARLLSDELERVISKAHALHDRIASYKQA